MEFVKYLGFGLAPLVEFNKYLCLNNVEWLWNLPIFSKDHQSSDYMYISILHLNIWWNISIGKLEFHFRDHSSEFQQNWNSKNANKIMKFHFGLIPIWIHLHFLQFRKCVLDLKSPQILWNAMLSNYYYYFCSNIQFHEYEVRNEHFGHCLRWLLWTEFRQK